MSLFGIFFLILVLVFLTYLKNNKLLKKKRYCGKYRTTPKILLQKKEIFYDSS